MIAILVAGHGNFAAEMVAILENSLGKQEFLETLGIKPGEGEYALNRKIDELMHKKGVDDILVLSDILGGSITNMCICCARNNEHIAVVTGVNLPMLVKAITYRNGRSLSELASIVCKAGQEGITIACKPLEDTDDDDS